MASHFTDPGPGWLTMNFGDAQVVEARNFPPGNWDKNGEMHISDIRFASPLANPSEARIEGKLATEIWVAVGPAKRDKLHRGIRIGNLHRSCKFVEAFLDLLERI